MSIATPAAVHKFWFDTLDASGLARAQSRARWFKADSAFDTAIRNAFAETVIAAGQDQLEHWCATPQGWLSYLLVCDQFPRNLWRGSARAFSLDERARKIARAGICEQHHRALGLDEQAFCFMPFMHSEILLDQYFSVGLFTTLRDHAPAAGRSAAGTYLRNAQQHRDTILEHGRFPYRDEALERGSA